MLKIYPFTFNPLSENTYILADETMECLIIDPGCYSQEEKKELEGFINREKLKPVGILLTHTHIDHILGHQRIVGGVERFHKANRCLPDFRLKLTHDTKINKADTAIRQ